MSTPIDKLEADKKANDTRIKELEIKILKYDDIIEKGGALTPDQRELLTSWRALRLKLIDSNDKLTHEMTELSKPPASALDPTFKKVFQVLLKRELRDSASSDGSGSKRSKTESTAFKDALITFYGCASTSTPQKIYCMLLNQKYDRDQVIASHIFPYEKAASLLMHGMDESTINDPRNGLLLYEPIEKALDRYEVCFVWNGTRYEFIFHVLCPDIKERYVEGQTKFKDLHGTALRLPKLPQGQAPPAGHPLFNCTPPLSGVYPASLPFRRFLGRQARIAFKRAHRAKWIGDVEYRGFQDYMKTSVNAVDPDEDIQKILDELQK